MARMKVEEFRRGLIRASMMNLALSIVAFFAGFYQLFPPIPILFVWISKDFINSVMVMTGFFGIAYSLYVLFEQW